MFLRPSARLQRYLGQELIADPNLAIIEFVKNAYDAGAQVVVVEFSLREGETKKLRISDNGIGMDEESFRANWLRPGFSAKSPDYQGPIVSANKNEDAVRLATQRDPAGEKGLGRLSAGRLGNVLHIWTRPSIEEQWLHVLFDWQKYENMNIPLDQVEIPFAFVDKPAVRHFQSGTIIQIEGLRQRWTGGIPGRPIPGRSRTRLGRLKQDLQFLVRPMGPSQRKFEIRLKSDVFTNEDDVGTIRPDDKAESSAYTYHFKLSTDHSGSLIIQRNLVRSAEVAAETGTPEEEDLGEVVVTPAVAKREARPQTLNCGPFVGTFVYSPPAAAKRAREIDAAASGVLLYRNGILVEPYGLPGDDWIGVEARKASRQGHAAIQPATFSGYVEITRANNPELEDTSNRLGLLENEASEDFFRHIRAEFVAFDALIYAEVLRPRWQRRAPEKAAARARETAQLTTVHLRATAHSLGQPLSALGFEVLQIQALADRSDVPVDAREKLLEIGARIERHIERLQGSVSKLNETKTPEFQVVPIASVVTNAIDETRALAELQDADVVVTGSIPTVSILAPPELVLDALTELINNALEASTTAPKKVVQIKVVEAAPTAVLIEVSDNGTGINGATTGGSLLGIDSTKGRPADGLPTVEEAVTISRGQVRISKTGPEGTTIAMTLPRAPS